MNLNDLFSVIDTDTLEQIDPITLMANPVILANRLSNDAANDHYENVVVKSVIQETVRQFEEVCPKLDAPTHYPKSVVESIRLTQSEETYPPTVNGKHSQIAEVYPHIEDRPPTWNMDRYAHMVKCQQCEHLTLTGHCRVKPQYKPMPKAMRDCGQFEKVSSERSSEVRSVPYSTTELNDLLSRYEKKLFNHLVDCVACTFMESRYCVDVFAIGSSYDAMLLVFDDAASKREALLNTVIRARISGRRVFVSLDHDKEPPPS